MMNDTKRFLSRVWLAGAVLAAACSGDPDIDPQPEVPAGGKVEVRIAASQPSATRTEIEENGAVTRWSPGDRIALWAVRDGAAVLAAQPFSLWHFGEEYPVAWFTSQIDPMAEGTYVYYGAYPVPDAVDGTRAEYDLPAVQDGSNDLRCAVMVGRPVQAAALTNLAEELHFAFVHKLHILKITVPEDRNLLGEPVSRLEIDFSRPVTGRLTVDVSDPDAPVALADGSSVLTLDFPAPVEAGAVVYAVIAPVDLTGSAITFRAYSERHEAEPIAAGGKNFEAGHTTPIRLTIPPLRKITRFYFSVGQGEEHNHLGQDPRSFVVRATDGTAFPDGSSELHFEISAENMYEYSYEGEWTDNLSGREFEVIFDSADATVRDTFTMDKVEVYGCNTVPTFDVPWLFFEDFSRMTGTFDSQSEFTSGFDSANASAVSLDQYGVTDWSGARIGGVAGANIRIASRVEIGLGIKHTMLGRVDSSPLWNERTNTGIKSGRSVKIRVTYDYAGDLHEGTGSGGFPVYYAGCTKTLVEKGDDAIERIAENVNGVVLASDGQNGSNAIYGYTPHTETYTMDNCDGETRLSWSVTNNHPNAFAANGQYWLYIDNIRVSIAQ